LEAFECVRQKVVVLFSLVDFVFFFLFLGDIFIIVVFSCIYLETRKFFL